jgi:transposase InsO family protein
VHVRRVFDRGRGAYGGRRLVGDITFLKTGEGWLYLAIRMVVGWQLADHMRITLIVDALAMAIDAGHIERDAVFHSYRGPVHLDRIRPVLPAKTRPDQRRTHRRVLGQTQPPAA